EAPLFRRQNRRLVLSEQGRVLLSYADRLLRLSAEAQAAVRDGAPQGLLRIGTMESTAAARLPPILAAYHAAWPQVRIELVTGTSGALAAKVRNYEIEAAFVAQPFEAQGLAQQPAFDEELALISPLAWPEIHGPKDVGDRSVIAFAAGCSYRRILEAWFGQDGVAPDKVMEFASYHAIVACVAAGSGVAIVPRSVLALLGAEQSLRVTPLSGKHGRAQTRLVWRADDETPALQALQQLLAQRRQ
ncbi:MAG: LysR substrate-binding domain-containing protein, partial [Achromobacter xylosoxidans]|nr:LysR substrate-binding domain-containing protein [Achromobacter xylosoxidans]